MGGGGNQGRMGGVRLEEDFKDGGCWGGRKLKRGLGGVRVGEDFEGG